MSAFKRKAPSAQSSAPGTRRSAYNASVLLSLGLASLDDVLGGGLPLGCVLLIEEDAVSSYARLLLKYWIAQALACKLQQVALVSHDALHGASCRELADKLMALENPSHAPAEEPKKGATTESMKIAFRYSGLKQFETTVSEPQSAAQAEQDEYCSVFDVTRRMELSIEQQQRLKSFELDQAPGNSLKVVMDRLEEWQAARKPDVPLRIAVHSLGHPASGTHSIQDIYNFLASLRQFCRRSRNAAVVTLPAHLFRLMPNGKAAVRQFEHACDAVLELESFADSPKLAAQFPRYHGILHVHKLPTFETLVPASAKLSVLRGLGTGSTASAGAGGMDNNLAFRLKRRRFVIETLHLDVDGVGAEQKQKVKEEQKQDGAPKGKKASAFQSKGPKEAKDKLKAANDW